MRNDISVGAAGNVSEKAHGNASGAAGVVSTAGAVNPAGAVDDVSAAFPAWLSDIRSAAGKSYREVAWPGLKDPDWRNSPAALFELERYTPAVYVSGEFADGFSAGAQGGAVRGEASGGADVHDDGRYSCVVRFFNGSPAMCGAPALPDGVFVSTDPHDIPSWGEDFFKEKDLSDKFHARLWAQASAFAVISVAPGVKLEKPILFDWVDDRQGVYVAPLVFFSLKEESAARLDLRWRSSANAVNAYSFGSSGVFLSPALFVNLDADSELTIFELVELAAGSRFLDYPTSRQGRGARLDWTRGFFGTDLVKSSLSSYLNGESSRFTVQGAYAATKGQHVDIFVRQHHAGRNTFSRSRFDGVADGNGAVIFRGLIEVEHGAAGTDAYLSNKALALSPASRVVSLPELTIDTNELSASHGSTVGTISPEELFYLESRGLSPAQAKALVASGLLGGILEKAPEELRGHVEALVDAALGGE